MAQQATVTLNAIAYAPAGTSNGISSWVDRSGGFGSSFSVITEKFATPSKDGQLVRMTFGLALPVVATEDTACVCTGGLLRTSTCQISVWIPLTSTDSERLDLWTRIKDYVNSDPFKNGVKFLDPSWG